MNLFRSGSLLAQEENNKEESTIEPYIAIENYTSSTIATTTTIDPIEACFMKDFDFGSNYEEFLPNLRYEKCYLACKRKKGDFLISGRLENISF